MRRLPPSSTSSSDTEMAERRMILPDDETTDEEARNFANVTRGMSKRHREPWGAPWNLPFDIEDAVQYELYPGFHHLFDNMSTPTATSDLDTEGHAPEYDELMERLERERLADERGEP
eukprot:CAMPEP_0170193426 /NCGR_PEP_ID=MMETSP0040_2-20121228/56837_1 /TAXON_ID=641309 /ORGANISM="Lotharella oceanica, Strain CCMP622" /LENGTH=117 /DNA_ID=CAMNT_0010442049 /DNA_START=1 /DNA_END=354 /DNA_ORIENTATION=+